MKKPDIKELTLREKIGLTVAVRQNLLVREKNLNQHLENNPYGCLWLLGRQNLEAANLSDEENWGVPSKSTHYKKWVEMLNGHFKMPLLVGLDGAGAFDDLVANCVAASIGATRSEELAYEYGKCEAREIRCAGANWWWSPVVDLTSRYCASSINRAFTSEPNLMVKLACAQIKGAQSQGVAATVKHFPGSDEIEYRDTHITPALIHISLEEWKKKQGKIFQEIFDAGVYSVMVGHNGFPDVDDTKVNGSYLPATLSYKIVTQLLKEEMGFKGVVITDGIGMSAVTSVYDEKRLYVELLKAGNDVILAPDSLDYIDTVENAVINGEIEEERINDACHRVLNMKEKLGLFDDNYQAGEELTEEILGDTRLVSKKIAEKSLTLVCDHEKYLPLRTNKIKKVAIICSTHIEKFYDSLKVMKTAFEKRGAIVMIQRRLTCRDEIKKISEEYDLIIYAGYVAPHQPMGASGFYGEEFKTFMFAYNFGKEKSISISFGSPYLYYDFYINSNVHINTYGFSKEIQEALVLALYGEIPFEGITPVNLIPTKAIYKYEK